jgi:uncharacterized protein YjdB
MGQEKRRNKMATGIEGRGKRVKSQVKSEIPPKHEIHEANEPNTHAEQEWRLEISPISKSIGVGQTQKFKATLTDGDSSEDVTEDVTWSSSDTATATIDSRGRATGKAIGKTVTITAASDSDYKDATARLTVGPPVLESITVSPSNASVTAGQTVQLTAVGSYSDGTSKNLTATTIWSSSLNNVASVNAGLVSAASGGSATITATDPSGTSGNSTVNVAAMAVLSYLTISPSTASVGAGSTLQLTATANYSDGSSQDVTTQASWTSSSPLNQTVATVSLGLVTGVGLGTATIQASYSSSPVVQPVLSNPATCAVLLNFSDLGAADSQAFSNASSRVNQLLTAFERRGNLSDAELPQLKDGLELVTQYLNNNPRTPVPYFNAASKAGNNIGDLQLLGLSWNPDWTKGPIGTGSRKANVIDDRYRAIGDYLYGPPPLAGLEHDPGSFPPLNGPNPGGLTDDQLRIAAVYGYVLNTLASPPPYRTIPSMVTPDDNNRRNLFNQTVEAADAKFRSNTQLYARSLDRLIQTSQSPQLKVSELSKVVDLLVQQGISPTNPQLNIWIDRALATAQNVGQDAQPSDIEINLPDLEQDVSNFEIISGNIFALQPAYFCSMLEELKVFQVVEKLVELFQNGVLPVVRGDAGNLLFAWWKDAALRVSESERRGFYARALGFPGGDADSPNREFKSLFMRFVSAVSSFVRQNTVDNLLRSNIPGAISQQQVRKSARDLATNISSHGYGIAYPMATELQKEINDVMAILKNSEIESAYGSKDPWQLVDQVAALELGGAANSVKYRTMASAGAVVFAWLANKSQLLATNSYVPIIDITMLQNPPSYNTKPTTTPSDFDLVGACDQWLAVTGTQEDSVEEAAQPVEAPVMPSRPIQIPSIARDMLESVGVPAMAYAASASKPNGAAYNWRVK